MEDKAKNAEKVESGQKEYIRGGLSDGMPVSKIAKKHAVPIEDIEEQIAMGIKVEHEHTPEDEIAAEISRDHLVEHPYYYTFLHKMEKEMEKDYEAKGYGEMQKPKGKTTGREEQAAQDNLLPEEKVKLRLKALFG